jgi:hypothetical protein
MSCCRISRSVRTTQTVIAPSTSRVRKCTRRHQSMPTTNCQLASPCMHQLHASRHGTMEPGDVVHQGTAPTPVCTGNCKDKLLNNMISTSCNGSINNRDRHHPTTGCGVGGSGRGGGSGGGGGGVACTYFTACAAGQHIFPHTISPGEQHSGCVTLSMHHTPAAAPIAITSHQHLHQRPLTRSHRWWGWRGWPGWHAHIVAAPRGRTAQTPTRHITRGTAQWLRHTPNTHLPRPTHCSSTHHGIWRHTLQTDADITACAACIVAHCLARPTAMRRR